MKGMRTNIYKEKENDYNKIDFFIGFIINYCCIEQKGFVLHVTRNFWTL